ncbi:AAA family ATPase [Tabrizicola sp. M-4]|uniref:AAA family ATPase n=1 Tax=Tabrizicola sp. M-4 TaxID=3055847 RepID=UPI003DA85A2F
MLELCLRLEKGWRIPMGDMQNIETDLIHLARVALSGRPQDVHLLLRKIAKGYREVAPNLAEQVTALLREAPTRSSPLRGQTEAALPVDVDTRFHLLRVEERPAIDHEPVLSDNVNRLLTRLVDERKHSQALLDDDLEPTKSAIFTGPPGVGKTLAARWVARSMGRPLVVLDLAAVMSSYLGRTGTNLRHVLDYAKSTDCVLLLDELDAIAKRRDDTGELGELKRLVTVLIQEIDDWPSSGVLLAATNHPELLDPAIWRRFDVAVEFPLPDDAAIRVFVQAMLKGRVSDERKWAEILALAFKGRSFSDIERDLLSARRAAAISKSSIDDHIAALIKGDQLNKADRIVLATKLVESGLASQRAAHELTGVSRDTIRTRSNTEMRPRQSGMMNG